MYYQRFSLISIIGDVHAVYIMFIELLTINSFYVFYCMFWYNAATFVLSENFFQIRQSL